MREIFNRQVGWIMSTDNRVKVWDIAVRVFHWSLVVFYVVAYLSGEEAEDGGGDLHALAGYVILGLICFRMVWGVIGTRYARFWNFIYSPHTTLTYLRSVLSGKPKHYIGHNPLGGWMVVLLLVSLMLAIWSGLEAYAVEGKGPLATNIEIIQTAYANGNDEHEHQGKREGDNIWEEIHEVFANLTLLLVILHISGVIFSSLVHRENLVRAMITGYKNKPPENL